MTDNQDKVFSALIVDDDEINLEILSDYLEAAGLAVMTVPDGESAVEVLSNDDYEFDVMFLDWMMPGISGLDVLKHVRASSKNASLPIIMQTAKASDLERREGLEAGADFYLSKPFDEGSFLSALQTTMPQVQFD
ncbi:MAG: response regulator [Oceanospirillaceae bacterium]|jgi:DNA-binding response OmpR family regulator|nr:response regulator [Oceanospirillaceae bacterium]MBT6076573.1 response regulator [Oceanospirillaceae bacterium]MBT7329580.1 response regulator [Oceanospirillaceae bacterium]